MNSPHMKILSRLLSMFKRNRDTLAQPKQDNGVSKEMSQNDKNKALLWAVEDEKLNTAIKMLENGADPFAVVNGERIIDVAANTGNKKLVNSLMLESQSSTKLSEKEMSKIIDKTYDANITSANDSNKKKGFSHS